MLFFLMKRRPPRSTRTTHSFPTRRSSELKRRRRSARQMAGRKSRPGKKSQKRHSGGQDITILLLKENVRDRIGAVEHEMHEIRRAQPCEHEQRGPQDRKSTRLNSSH